MEIERDGCGNVVKTTSMPSLVFHIANILLLVVAFLILKRVENVLFEKSGF